MMIGKGNRNTRRKSASSSHCPPQSPHDLSRREPGPPRRKSNDKPLEPTARPFRRLREAGLIMVHILNRLRNNLFNYTTCFDPNGPSSGVFSYTSFTIELHHEIRTFLHIYIVHKRLRSFSFTPYLGIST
jgi:hypothetical protein